VGSPDNDSASQYVSTGGNEFRFDDRPYTVAGTNSFWCTYSYWDRSAIDETIADAVAMDLNTLRVWGFGSGSPQLFQPAAREYNEAAFERFDHLIEQARANDIKLVVALGNYWPDFGGIDQYVEWSDNAETRSDFYEDETCQSIYRDYLRYVLTRKNTLTGAEYREDPTIMLWELLNEARHPAAHDGEVLHRWAHDTARFVKSLDDAHLVSTGVEGFVLGATAEYDDIGYWMNTQGYDFVGIHDSPYIDAASIHLYPDSWRISNAAAIQFLRDRAREAATELDKPIYVGEFGKAVNRHATDADRQLGVRNERYAQWYDVMAGEDVNGALFWQLVPDAYADDGDEFTVNYPRDRSTAKTIRVGNNEMRN
jgi:mannan endo-1,4-beta-mannosidase